jgi:Fic family protein
MRKPKSPPSLHEILSEQGSDPASALQALYQPAIQEFVRQANDRYLHWHKLRFQPMPAGLDPRTAWAAVEMSRIGQRVELPISFVPGENLTYWLPPQHMEWLHRIDKEGGGSIGSATKIPNDGERYLYSTLMEEAIASSQLEGASTTRRVAKEMLRLQREPRDRSEQMILNNYQAVLEIQEELRDAPLTPDLLLHLQSVLVEKASDHPDIAGRFRRPDEIVEVVDQMDEVMHVPPIAQSIDRRIKELCEFANTKSKPFIHPVIKAIVLHFAIGFIHPFVDGNGRTARAVFYWYMLKSGYWLFEYLSISRILLDGPARYSRAFLYTESDHGDVTYFAHYHLGVINRAIKELHEYILRQQQELTEATRLLDQFPGLNHRQVAVVADFLKQPLRHHTVKQHATTHRVTLATARADLFGLVKAGLLTSQKVGRRVVFEINSDITRRLRKAKSTFERERQDAEEPTDRPTLKSVLRPESAAPASDEKQQEFLGNDPS